MGEGKGDSESSAVPAAAGIRLKLNPTFLSAAAVSVLLIVSFFLWTLPFRHNELPFGEGDSAWHFAIGDHISSSDRATFRLPYYIGVWYYGFNKILGPFAPEYPPSSHVNYALMQIVGGERFVPVFIYRAIASFLGALAVFFVVSRLFGVLPAFIAALGLSFSLREQLTYLFGQQPTLTAIIITPVAAYAWYKYLTSFYLKGDNGSSSSKEGGDKIYIFITFALLASQYLLHLQGFVASAVVIAVMTVLFVLRFRKIPLAASFAVAILLFAVVAAPFASIYLGAGDVVSRSGLGRLFEWGISPADVQGSFPPSFVQFLAEYPKLLLPFLLAGLTLLLLRLFLVKNNARELFLLSWLIGAYLATHLDVFVPTGLNRLARMLVLENYIFYTLIALTVVWLPATLSSLLKFNARFVSAAKYSLAVLLIISLIMSSGKATYSNLSQAYSGIDRITPAQADFAANYISKLPEDAYVFDPSIKIVGQWRYPKLRWMLAISQRFVGRYDGGPVADADHLNKDEVYFLFDYSDIALFASSPQYKEQAAAWASQLNQLELAMFNGTQPLYDANNIRLYKYSGKPVEAVE